MRCFWLRIGADCVRMEMRQAARMPDEARCFCVRNQNIVTVTDCIGNELSYTGIISPGRQNNIPNKGALTEHGPV